MSSTLRIIVTGSSGRIGSRLMQTLIERGHEVTGIDQHPPRQTIGRFVQIDLRDRTALEPIMRQADAICHLGEIPGMHAGFAPEVLFANNCAAGSNVLQTAVDLKLRRIVYVSSCQVYGYWGSVPRNLPPPPCWPMDERAPLLPQDAYALAKVTVEKYAELLATPHAGASIAAIRFPWVCNEEEASRIRARLDTANDLREGLNTILHLDDASSMLMAAVESDRSGFEAYHAVAPDILSCRPTGEVLKEQFGSEPVLPPDFPTFASPVTTEKAREHFGWVPQFRLHDEV